MEHEHSRSRHAGSRFRELNTFVDVVLRLLPPGAIATWLVLYRDVKPNGLASTSVNSIAERAGCNRRSVLRMLRRLELSGFIEVVRRGSLNHGCSVYRVHAIPLLATAAVAPAPTAPAPPAPAPKSRSVKFIAKSFRHARDSTLMRPDGDFELVAYMSPALVAYRCFHWWPWCHPYQNGPRSPPA
jgi:hypothetical protein